MVPAVFSATLAAPLDVIQGAVVHVDARWGGGAAPGQDYDVCLALGDTAGGVAHSQCVPLSPTWPPSRWEADEIVRSAYAVPVPLSLEPGAYSLTLTLAEPSTGAAVGRPADLGRLQVDVIEDPALNTRTTLLTRASLLLDELVQGERGGVARPPME